MFLSQIVRDRAIVSPVVPSKLQALCQQRVSGDEPNALSVTAPTFMTDDYSALQNVT